MTNVIKKAVAAVTILLTSSSVSAQSRVTGHLGVGAHPTTNEFNDATAVVSNRETGNVTGRYDVGAGKGIEGGVTVGIWKNTTVGVMATISTRTSNVVVDGSFPHPFFFNSARLATTSIDHLGRTDIAIHPSVGLRVPTDRRFDVAIFGGPSIFKVTQPTIDAVSVTESYPYDSVALSTTQSEISTQILGFHAGATVAWYLTKNIGIGTSAKYTTGSKDVRIGDGALFALKTGGPQIAVGIHFRTAERGRVAAPQPTGKR